MNTNLIKRFKEQFDWWLENDDFRQLWVKKNNAEGWVLHHKFFNYYKGQSEYVKHIVIADEYAEFRKAEADGIQVEGLNKHIDDWSDRTPFHEYGQVFHRYRIKQDNKWQDNISKETPVFCKGNIYLFKVIDYKEGEDNPYVTTTSSNRCNLEPIMADDLQGFQRKGYYSVAELLELNKEAIREYGRNNSLDDFLFWLSGKETAGDEC